MSDEARRKATVYVGGLSQRVTESLLADAFVPFGEIVEVSIPAADKVNDGETHKGFGYVEFEEEADALEAIDNMNQSEMLGKIIKVAAARPQKATGEGLGSKTAIWEQEGYISRDADSEAAN